MRTPRTGRLAITLVTTTVSLSLLTGCFFNNDADDAGNDNTATEGTVVDQNIVKVEPDVAEQSIEDGDTVVLDIRTPAEYDQGHIAGAENIDYYQNTFADELDKLDKNAKYVMYCQSGNRSAKAAQIMRDLGFTNVEEIGGGIQAWQGAELPVERSE